MKSRTTWILLALALIVSGIVYWDSRTGTTTADALLMRKRLVNLKADDVTRVELVRSNETVIIAKEADRWLLKKPLSYRASGTTVSSIINEISLAEVDRVLAGKDLEEANMAEFGLAEPRIRVKLAAPKGTVDLAIGSETPTKEAVYVQVAGEKRVAITHKSLVDRLTTRLGDLREHDVLDTAAVGITRLEIRNADRVLELTKSVPAGATEPRWSIAKPQALRADQRKVGDLVSDLSYLRVAEFVGDDVKDLHPFQLDEPIREVTVFTGDKSKTLQFGKSPTNDAAKVYARLKGTDTVFTISADAAQKLAVQPNDLRDGRILSFDKSAVTGLSLPPMELVADSNKVWSLTAPKSMPVDQERVNNLLLKLHELSATQFVADVATDLAKYGLAAPASTLTLRGEGTNVLAQLLISPREPAQLIRYVKRADEPFVYGVANSALEWLPADALALRVRQVAGLKPSEITQVTREQGGKVATVAKDAEGKWSLVQPAEGVLDMDNLTQLLESMSHLEAREFVREGDSIQNPEIKIVLKAGEKSYTALISAQAENGDRQVAWSDPALVFVTPGYNLTAATRELISVPVAITGTNAAPATTPAPTP